MALVLKDRVKETTVTTGTGTYTLDGAVAGFESFGEIGNANTTYYACSDGTDFEIGIGTYTASGTTLARTTILQSSNSDAAVNWTAGTRTIFCTLPAEKMSFLDASGNIVAANGSALTALNASNLGSGTVANARLDAQLQDVAGLAVTNGGFIVGNGSNFVLETEGTARTSLGLGTSAVLDTGISDTNVPKFTSGVADDDFLRVAGTAIEGRSAAEVASDIGAALLTGATFTGAVAVDNITIDTNTISTTDTNGSLLLTPNGTGNVTAETDTLTLKNTSDAGTGPSFVLNHATASPATTDTSAIEYKTTDAGGNAITAARIRFRAPDLTSGAAAGRIDINVKETSSNVAQTYFRLEGNAEQVTFFKPIVINAALDIEEVHEKVTVITSTTGTLTFDTAVQGVVLGTANQAANRTINFTNVNSTLATGQSVTCAVLLTQGSTAYYLNAYQVDSSSVTPKWQGGTAPSAGNASGIDAYSFTIIKTADATFTVLASQTQFA